jgi:autotransporter-associated beta strand protein
MSGNWLRVFLVAACAAFSIASYGGEAFAAPNVVLIVADDMGYADVGFMNQFTGQTTQFKTPNLDALAQQSVVFSNAYVSASGCSPSRAGMLTGRYQEKFGMDYNINATQSPLVGVPGSEVMVSEALKQLGYSTGAVGKWHVGHNTDQRPRNNGFDEFYGLWEGSRSYFYAGPNEPSKIRRADNTIVQWQDETSFNGVPNDPVLGRHLTDAFGDEASKFIANHANQAAPFFLYVPFTSPHGPYDKVKQQDLDQFATSSLTGLRKNDAALTYGLDRNVGSILARIDDPNGDGNTSDSIADETIVVFINDNGGSNPNEPASGGEMVHDNTPLRDYKGSAFEGGFRVPMMIRMPGVTSGVSNEPVIALDLFPTFVAAAGGAVAPNIDGENLLPLLQGTQTGAVHDALFWRGGLDYHMAVRKGEWKLVRGTKTAFHRLVRLNPDGSGETDFLESQEPQKFQELIRDFVNWEVTLAKPTQTDVIALNRFDAFRFRNDQATTNWRATGQWVNDASPSTVVTMMRQDPYANAALVFTPRNDASYTSTNDISRISGLDYTNLTGGGQNPSGFAEFMLNELRFAGTFLGAANQSGTLNGYPLMFVNNLSGQAPRMVLGAAAAGGGQFTFNVNMDVVLHGNLEITGNGGGNYVVGGQIRNFFEPRSVTKTGSSIVTLSGNNTYSGATIINQGTLRVAGATAALANTSSVQVGPQGTLALASGLIRTPSLQIVGGGTFNFTGGVLEAGAVSGNLVINGGEFRPGMSAAVTQLNGSFDQNAGMLSLEIGGTAANAFDQLVVSGSAQLDGNLNISLLNSFTPALGNVFQVLTASGGITGDFDAITVPALPGGRKWAIQIGAQSMLLKIVNQLAGDFDANGIVNIADLQAWKTTFPGSMSGSDFLTWQRELGTRIIPTTPPIGAVPEPGSAALFVSAMLAAAASRRRRFAASISINRRPTY